MVTSLVEHGMAAVSRHLPALNVPVLVFTVEVDEGDGEETDHYNAEYHVRDPYVFRVVCRQEDPRDRVTEPGVHASVLRLHGGSQIPRLSHGCSINTDISSVGNDLSNVWFIIQVDVALSGWLL